MGTTSGGNRTRLLTTNDVAFGESVNRLSFNEGRAVSYFPFITQSLLLFHKAIATHDRKYFPILLIKIQQQRRKNSEGERKTNVKLKGWIYLFTFQNPVREELKAIIYLHKYKRGHRSGIKQNQLMKITE